MTSFWLFNEKTLVFEKVKLEWTLTCKFIRKGLR